MANFPGPRLNKGILSSCSPEAGIHAAVSASLAWPSGNTAIFTPVHVRQDFAYNKLFWFNGATASGAVDMGIYDANGTRLVSTGSTVQSGVSTSQSVSVTAGVLTPGLHYLALALNGITGTIIRAAPGLQNSIWLGMARMATAFPLPATATLVQAANSYIPLLGATALSTF